MAAINATATMLSETVAAAPPSAPGVTNGAQWLPLVYSLSAAYALIMTCVVVSFCLCSRRTAVQPDDSLATAILIEEGSQPRFHTVKRGASAIAGWSGPGVDLARIERSIKMGFLRKVYSILATQMLVTVGVVVGFIYLSFNVHDGAANPHELTSFGSYVLSNSWVILVSLIPLLFVLCCLTSLKNTYPLNYFALALFTLLESATLGFICVLYYERGFGDQIVLAAAITLSIFLVLTLYTMQSKVDWSVCGAGLTAGLFIMVRLEPDSPRRTRACPFFMPLCRSSAAVNSRQASAPILTPYQIACGRQVFWSWWTFWLLPFSTFQLYHMISLLGALLFCGFIVYDTHMIMTHFGVDDYIIAAIELYLDVINLFQYLLLLLTMGNNN